jgi:hypothetical protein
MMMMMMMMMMMKTVVVVVILFSIIVLCIFISLLFIPVRIMYIKIGSMIEEINNFLFDGEIFHLMLVLLCI